MGTEAAQGGHAVPEQRWQVLKTSVTPHDECDAQGTILPRSLTS